MNGGQQQLFDRLKKSLDKISESVRTEAQVGWLLEDFVISLEEISSSLEETSDQETAAALGAIIHYCQSDQKDNGLAAEVQWEPPGVGPERLRPVTY